jgi:hypothetical protein
MSKIEVDAIDKQSGSTLTLGGSGTAVTLACGATQTGFGRTGTVDWQTSSIKTATFTAANGEGYFCNTTGGSFEVDLPAGSPGAIVSIQDYNNTFDSNSLTVDPNGTEKINGGDAGGFITLSTEGLGITFVYIDATVGWRSVDSNEYKTGGSNPTFICASVSGSGNTLVTAPDCANAKIATFTGPGNFTVNSISCSAANNEVSYMVVAGGGGGGNRGICTGEAGGAGGAGGFRETKSPVTPYTASPLDGQPSSPNRITVTAATFPIVVGAGGTAAPGSIQPGVVSSTRSGSNSSFSTITSAGGGGGGNRSATTPIDIAQGAAGGSGGGGSFAGPTGTGGPGGSGNSPSTSPAQGSNGGNGPGPGGRSSGGGGGGATAVGGIAGFPCGGCTATGQGGPGGAGATTSISATPTAYAGGGGGGGNAPSYPGKTSGDGGTGGGGNGGDRSPTRPAGVAGTTNTGGGGGGGSGPGAAGTGGSGIVIIRYKFQ